MPVALGFFGFARTLNVDIHRYLDLIGTDPVDIYIVIPDQLGEFDETSVLESDLRAVFSDERIRSLTIKLFKYDAAPHVLRAKQLGLPLILPHCQYHPYRVISLIGSITRLATAMQIASNDIDTYILTRIDMIPITSAFGPLTVDNNTVFGWRTCPFVQDGIIEDRLIVCGRGPLESLARYYDSFPNLGQERFGSELILGEYMLSNGHTILPQNSIIGISPYTAIKYTHTFCETAAKTYAAAIECNPSSS